MPGPDPHALSIEEHEDGGFSITYEHWEHGNRGQRIARVRAVARNFRFNGWNCRRCSEPIPLHRRADARYCSEGCRKASARERRARREAMREALRDA